MLLCGSPTFTVSNEYVIDKPPGDLFMAVAQHGRDCKLAGDRISRQKLNIDHALRVSLEYLTASNRGKIQVETLEAIPLSEIVSIDIVYTARFQLRAEQIDIKTRLDVTPHVNCKLVIRAITRHYAGKWAPLGARIVNTMSTSIGREGRKTLKDNQRMLEHAAEGAHE